jgi:hypothetical protein
MEIDTALVLGGLVLEVIGETRDGLKFMPGCWIEIGIAAAIDGAVAQSEIGQAGRAVVTDWNISSDIGHEIMDAGIPF